MKTIYLLIIFLIFYSFLSIFLLFPISSIEADEGTHLLIGLFYHDAIKFVLKNGFSNVYNFGIDYLVHYPKLSIYYPPVYHLSIAFAYIFGISTNIGRFVTLVYSLGAILLTYKVGEMLFNERVGFLSSIFLACSPAIVRYSRSILMDIPLLFFFLLTFYFYLLAFKTKKNKYYILGSLSLAAGYLTKWLILPIIPILGLYILSEKNTRNFKTIKKYILSLFLSLIFLTPYLILSYKLDLMKLMYKATLISGIEAGKPQVTTIEGWLYNPKKFISQLSPPIALLSLVSLILMIWKKQEDWKLILIWVLVIFIVFTISPNKSDRYTISYLPPFLFSFSYLLDKLFYRKKYYLLLIIFLIILEYSLSLYYITKIIYPIEEVTRYIFNRSKGNVAFISEKDQFYTSSFMFNLARIDRNRTIQVFRPCVFEKKSEEEIQNFLTKNNIHYLVFVERGFYSENFDKIKNITFEKEIYPTKIYVFDNFVKREGKKCNYICLTGDEICSKL